MRIQTVDVEGTAQNFNELAVHSSEEVAQTANPSPDEWKRLIEYMNNLSELASKASENQSIRTNKADSKTGILPDLISSEKIEERISPDTPKKKLLVLEKTGEKIQGLKVEFQRQELLKSPINPTVTLPGDEKPANHSMFPSASPTPSVKGKVPLESESSKFPTGSHVKVPVFVSNDKPNIVKMEKKIHKAEFVEPDEKLCQKKSHGNVNLASKSLINMEKKQPVETTSKDKPQMLSFQPNRNPESQAALNPKLPLLRKKLNLNAAKPPNILVYSDSTTTRSNVIKTLGAILQKNTYCIYPLSDQQACSRVWLDNTTLLVVCGSVNGSGVDSIFLDFFFKGGKVLCLCSDLLGSVLPSYHTAEVFCS